MLLKSDAERQALLKELALVAPEIVMPPSDEELFVRVRGTAEEAAFPGAVLLASRDGRLYFYAVAQSDAEWRELAPLLLASVGATTTDFTGWANQELDDDPVAGVLRSYGMYAISRFEAYGDPKREHIAVQALARLRALMQKAATVPRSLPRSTFQALYDFRLALAVGDREGAEAIVTFLREEMRIDTINRSFLEIRLLEAFGDWGHLAAHRSFATLCSVRRPPAVTSALVEALYRTAIAPAEEANDAHKALELFRQDVADRSGTLFTVCPPEPRPAVGKAFLLATLAAEKPDFALIKLLDSVAQTWPADEVGFFHRLRTLVPSPVTTVSVETTLSVHVGSAFDYETQLTTAQGEQGMPTVERARAVLSAAFNIQSLRAYEIALDYISRMHDEARERLLGDPLTRQLWEGMVRYGAPRGRVPHSWLEWIEMLPEMTQSQAVMWAEAAETEYPVAQQLQHPEDVDRLVAALNNPPTDAQERLFEALPTLVTWVCADYRWPNPANKALYRELFDLLLLGCNFSQDLYKALGILLNGLLDIGLDSLSYRDVLRHLGDNLSSLSSTRDLDWLCDLAELTITYRCPNAEDRARFWHQLLAVVAQYGTRLTASQRRVLAEVAGILDLADSLAMLPEAPTESPRSSRAHLARQTVAIYTLTVGVGERIARILADEYPGIKVRVNHDKVSTPQLRDLAKHADVFVICWLSAKHAATDAIKLERPANRETIYASGKGSSSICRAIGQYLGTHLA